MDLNEFRELFFSEVIAPCVGGYGTFDKITVDSIGVCWVDEESLCAEVTFYLEAVEVHAVVRRDEGGCWQIEIGEEFFEDLCRESLFLRCMYSILDTHKKYKDEVEKAMEILDYEEDD